MTSVARAARAIAAVALTAVVLWQADAGAVIDALRLTSPIPLLLAAGVVLIDRALMAWRWMMLLGALAPPRRPALGPVMRLFFVSTFVGTFLPASIGGDAVRTAGTIQLGVPAGDAAASVLLDRLLGIVGILVLAAAGVVTGGDLTRSIPILSAFAVTLAVAGAGAALIFSDRAAAAAHHLARHAPGARLRAVVGDLIAAIQGHRTRRIRLSAVLAASVAVQALRVVEAWLLGVALDIPVGLTTYFAFVPLILLVMLLPVTINGIGTSQAAFVWLFGRAGVEPGAAFALSVLFLALGIFGNLPGALIFAFGPANSTGNARRPA